MPTPVLARILTPEKGAYLVRCPLSPPPQPGAPVVVSLDYGPDIATVENAAPRNPAVHGEKIPSFSILRPPSPQDLAAAQSNLPLASQMADLFAKSAGDGVRIVSARLSLGKTRLFLRYSSPRPIDVAPAAAEINRICGAVLHARQCGPRDEVRILGALGPCGRVCCCSSWQRKYPAGLVPERFKKENSATLNGVCNRVKCCLAFE